MYKVNLLNNINAISTNKVKEFEALIHTNRFIAASTIEAGYGDSFALFGHLRKAGENLPSELSRVDGNLKGLSSPDNRVPPFLRSQLFIASIASIEDYLSQLMKEILVSYPEKISVKSTDSGNIINSGDVKEIIEMMAEKHVTDSLYKKPEEYKKSLIEIISAEKELLDIYWDSFIEMKASRDAGMHGGWRSNSIYLRKAGSKARTNKLGEYLPITVDYFNESVNVCKGIVNVIHGHINEKFNKCTPAYVFCEMWEKSSLSRIVAFRDVWFIETPYMVRPVSGFKWGWSTSEELLYRFFLGIYEGKDTMPFLPSLLERLNKNDANIVKLWLCSPFFF
ncbi:hypothetical protein [Neobacillus rhizophilus]|uniref:Uncharacterized protein n=1 Tax=Neobacillus rhizophilus TaxID=2833579 RepID=A0A942U697_9BACI|nr:hypothetical protein [Neobacillus rhizophilus]MBS4213242.1 hypothetical protein [Neobacillus rhizophilus]